MIIEPKTRGFICTTAHPTGCQQHVREQIDFVRQHGKMEGKGPRFALVIGASTGYGLASRITGAFGAGADTIGVAFERPASGKRTATAGWYNTAFFEREAKEAGLYSESIIGDAFSDEIKAQVIDAIKRRGKKVDLVIYSLAAPRRVHPKTKETFTSVLKPIGAAYTNKTVDFHNGVVTDVTIEPATEEEIRHTIAVMGGEDWEMWIDALQEAGVLADDVKTVAYSYIGPELTYPIYREGTIGRAKLDLEQTARRLHDRLSKSGGAAYVSVNKALVTQSSAAIPVVPLYISLLFKVMKEKNIHENCIGQMIRLFKDRLYAEGGVPVDEQGLIRIDDLEMREDVQALVRERWEKVNTENLHELTDIEGYRAEFFRLFGFGFENVDYEKDVDPDVSID